jgi:hypothetical protein
MDWCGGRRCEEVNGCKELEESSAGKRGMEGLDSGGQGPTSGCCAIEEEEEETCLSFLPFLISLFCSLLLCSTSSFVKED